MISILLSWEWRFAGAEQTSAPGPDQLAVLPPSTLRTSPVTNEAWSDAIKTIALATSSERPSRPIGTLVTRAALFSGVPVGRGDVDNAAAALSLHGAHLVLHAQDHAENIGVECRGITFRGLVGDRADLAFGAGIIHRDIEAAKPRDGLVDQSADVILLAHIGADKIGLGAERAQGFDKLLALFVAPA